MCGRGAITERDWRSAAAHSIDLASQLSEMRIRGRESTPYGVISVHENLMEDPPGGDARPRQGHVPINLLPGGQSDPGKSTSAGIRELNRPATMCSNAKQSMQVFAAGEMNVSIYVVNLCEVCRQVLGGPRVRGFTVGGACRSGYTTWHMKHHRGRK